MEPDQLSALTAILRKNAPLLVAYSGGVDSACLLAFAHRTLGDQVMGVIADSPSLPRKALAAALDLAGQIGVVVEVVETQEFQDPRYTSNPVNRCYFCKSELFARLDALAEERGFAAIAYGENADDPAHLRPGSRAAQEFAVLAPLKEAGLNKAAVRSLARELHLPVADAPAQPCLSSRVAHGLTVTPEVLQLVENGEEMLRELGFRVFRVRYVASSPPKALIQIAPVEFPLDRQARLTPLILEKIREAGFAEVTIDPAGYTGISR